MFVSLQKFTVFFLCCWSSRNISANCPHQQTWMVVCIYQHKKAFRFSRLEAQYSPFITCCYLATSSSFFLDLCSILRLSKSRERPHLSSREMNSKYDIWNRTTFRETKLESFDAVVIFTFFSRPFNRKSHIINCSFWVFILTKYSLVNFNYIDA